MSYLVDLRDTVSSGMGAVRRVGPWPLGIRGAVFVAGLGVMALALPASMAPASRVLVAALLALLPALTPGSWTVSALELVTVLTWLLRPMSVGSASTWLALVALAALLYLHHTAAALAAMVPLDTALSPAVVSGWLRRACVVVAATVLLGGCGLVASAWLGVVGTAAVPVAGVFAALAVGWLLLRTLRR